MEYDFLVNKEHPLERDYVPNHLVLYKGYNGPKIDNAHQTMIVDIVLKEFKEMQFDAQKEGYYLLLDSGYRSYEYQEKILEENIRTKGADAYKYVAFPGTSEHQTGLALDLAIVNNYKTDYFNDEEYYAWMDNYCDSFDDTYPEIKWVHNNAWKYGFILRYPRGEERITGYNYECWHLRYVGREVSKYIYENNISTLEEYHSIKKRKLTLLK